MNILYLGYWSVLDGLSESTIRPHLKVLDDMPEVNKIVYISIERTTELVTCSWPITKMDFIPFYSPPKSFFRDKLFDFTQLPDLMVKLCKERAIDKIICRSSLAGAIGYLVWKRVKIPYYVESFEPHADYMLESGVWKKWDIRYYIQRYFEKLQKKTSAGLIPVSENYFNQLAINEKANNVLGVVPCTVDLQNFQFNSTTRENTRDSLGVDEGSIIGIYVGKFGDIYYLNESFDFFKYCVEHIPKFFLVILSPSDPEFIKLKLIDVDYPMSKCWFGKVPFETVVNYLSASDFAFCPVRPTPSKKYCSPIKNGEYWANGLPVVISGGIGDDSDIINESQQGGLVVDFENQGHWADSLGEMECVTQKYTVNRENNECVQLAKNHRDASIVHKIYKKMIEH